MTWWRHRDMETLSILLARCEGIHPWISLTYFWYFVWCLPWQLLDKHTSWWFETPRRSCDITLMDHGKMDQNFIITTYWSYILPPDLLFNHDDVIKWKHFPRYWPFVRRIHRSPVNSPHKGQWRGALMFSLICVWIIGWVNNREAGDLRRYGAHRDVIVMKFTLYTVLASVLEFLISICGLLYTWFTHTVPLCHQFTSIFLSFQLTYLFMTGILVGIVIFFQVPLYVDRQNLPAFLLLVILFG